jgi:hypothetical protein
VECGEWIDRSGRAHYLDSGLIYSAQPGFVRLFAQVQIDGVAGFADFGLIVEP